MYHGVDKKFQCKIPALQLLNGTTTASQIDTHAAKQLPVKCVTCKSVLAPSNYLYLVLEYVS